MEMEGLSKSENLCLSLSLSLFMVISVVLHIWSSLIFAADSKIGMDEQDGMTAVRETGRAGGYAKSV